MKYVLWFCVVLVWNKARPELAGLTEPHCGGHKVSSQRNNWISVGAFAEIFLQHISELE
jgi:hypothetical protein